MSDPRQIYLPQICQHMIISGIFLYLDPSMTVKFRSHEVWGTADAVDRRIERYSKYKSELKFCQFLPECFQQQIQPW